MEELWVKIKVLLVHLTHFQKRNRIKRYGLPVLLITIVFFLKNYFHDVLGHNTAFLMVSFIVAVSSWYGGLRPGIFATLLSATLTYFIFLKYDISTSPFVGDLVLTAIFIVEGVIISIALEARFEMEEQKDEFIAFMAHELKNPLAAVIGFSNLIVEKAKGNDKTTSYGHSIAEATNKMLELINDLLDIASIEIGKFTYSDSFFNMTDLATEVIAHQRIIAKNRTIEFKGLSKQMLYGDRYRIGQIITNLLTNAIKYSPQKKKIIVKLKETKGKVSLSVRDFGLGIAKKDQKQIFSRFYRAHDVVRSKSEGLGLGLFICQQIIRHHKGKLWVKSKIGHGSTFFLELPLRPIQESI